MAREEAAVSRTYTLVGADRRPYRSPVPGQFGGHRQARIYGRLDCPSAWRAIARGGYVAHRVFFADEPTAAAAGYRPCAVCLPAAYAAWKSGRAPPWPGGAGPATWPGDLARRRWPNVAGRSR